MIEDSDGTDDLLSVPRGLIPDQHKYTAFRPKLFENNLLSSTQTSILEAYSFKNTKNILILN